MTHANDGQLLAYLDGELEAGQHAELTRHLSACGQCASELRELESISAEFHDAVSWLDAPISLARAEQRLEAARLAIAAESAAGAPASDATTATPLDVARRSRFKVFTRLGPAGLLKAAALAGLLAGAVSAAIPGTPVREWVESTFGLADVEAPAPAPEPVEVPVPPVTVPEPPAQEPVPEVMLRQFPDEGRVTVRLHDVAGRVVVRYVDEDRAAIRTPNAGAMGFSAAGELEARRLGTDVVYIDIPVDVVEATVEVDGQPYLEKRGGETRTPGPLEASTANTYSFRRR